MPKKQRKFADDGWAVWIDGEDTSTIHINDWLNPKGNSYVDIFSPATYLAVIFFSSNPRYTARSIRSARSRL